MSTAQLNPNATATAGLEWLVTRAASKPLSSAAATGGRATSTAAESIAALHAWIGPGLVGVDVYNAADVWAAGEVLGGLSRPALDFASSVGWEQTINGGTAWEAYKAAAHPNGYSFVNKVVDESMTQQTITALMTVSGTLVRYVPTGSQLRGRLQWQMANTWNKVTDGTAGNDPSAKRVGRIEVSVVARAANGTASLDSELNIGGTYYGSDGGPIFVNSSWNRYVFSYAWNPATGQQWTNSDIATFLSGGANAFGITIAGTAGVDYRVGAVNIVFRALPERRVATGYAVTAGWSRFLLTNPLTGATAPWAKASGPDYLFLFYLPGAAGGAGGVQLLGADDTGVFGSGLTGWRSALQPVSAAMVPNQDPFLASGPVPALFMEKADTTLGADLQPYSTAGTTPVYSGVGATKQGIAGHATATYGNVTVLLAKPAVTPTGPLVVRMRLVAGDAQIGGDVTIQPSDVVYNSAGFAKVTARAASGGALASGTAYYLQFTSTTPVGAPWQVAYAATDTTATADATTAAAGTISGAATLNGVVNALADIVTNIATIPAAPTSLAATVASIANRPVLSYAGIGVAVQLPATIQYAHLTWTATALGATFGYYEVQRDGATIAYITAESSVAFNDIEGPRGIAGDLIPRVYRIRAVRADGAVSDWAVFPTVNVSVLNCADVVVSSNSDPANALAFRDLTPTHQWDQLQTPRGKMQPIMGRDYPVAFWPAEQGGETFTRKLAVAYNDPAVKVGGSVNPDRAVFDPAVNFLQNRALPYVAYADAYGRQWLTSPAIQSPGPTRVEPNGAYSLTVLFTQIEPLPVPVTVAVPTVLP